MASSSSSGQMTHPQAAVGASPCRYRVGSRVLMVSERRRDDKFQWVEAEVSKLEPTAGGTRVCIREVGGMDEEFEPVVMPHTTAAFQRLPDIYAGGDGFHYFDHVPPTHHHVPGQSVDELDAERFCVDLSIKQRDAEDPMSFLLLPPSFMPPLPTDIIATTLLPLCGGRETLALKLKSTLCCTSTGVGDNIGSAAVSAIDSIIEKNGLTGAIGYAPLRRHLPPQLGQSMDVCRPFQLIRLHYLMVTGGDWQGSVPVLRFAKSCGRVQQLPIELTGDDLRHVGSKAVIDSRPPSMRQYALYSNRLGNWMHDMLLTRTADRTDRVDGREVTVHTRQTVPAEYADRFDPDDPPCRDGGFEYGSFRGRIINSLALSSSSSCYVSGQSYSPPSAGCDSIGALMAQEPPLEGDDFAAYIQMHKWPSEWAHISLYTSEERRQGDRGPAASPRTVDIAHNKMDRPSLALLPAI
ncbi:unnamed protein product [Vitrella brassicaformis CCMP3155]|uniref:Uncharacterized protein n=1 Tax=Vitrella brassicaformis (strain CCMP3155) TaxID=1169540 RepID=A0A0G4G078_VITBC|nr:unnamed protein product [Vitrella brassicaformis CCMP3155]|eukprot:CEM21261.1 unnamed protein product [Vitrella brassicaformis CCMP3155]